MPISLNCQVCNKEFMISPRTLKDKIRGKYCCLKCSYIGRRTKKIVKCKTCNKEFSTYKGIYCSKKCYGINNRDYNNYLWKSDKASYRTKHKWIILRLGKANHCELCKLSLIPKGKKRYFDWCNISGKYIRNEHDWIQLCRICHRKLDKYRQRFI